MENFQEFLSEVKKLGIKIFLDGNNLRCNAPKGAITPEIKANLTNWKSEIVAYLRKQNQQDHIVPTNRDNIIPLSYAQSRLWFIDELESGKSTKYNTVLNFQIKGNLNVEGLKKSLQAIVNRHEILRTNFQQINGSLQQIVHSRFILEIPVIDLSHIPETEQTKKIEELIANNQRPFNLATDSLIRTKLVQLGTEYYILLITFHHIIFDAWSVGIFIQELSNLYQAYTNNISDIEKILPELPIQYADFAVWQQQYMSGEVLETQLNYWKKQLANLPEVLELPTNKQRYLAQNAHGANQNFTLNTALTQQLKDLSRQERVTTFNALLAAFATLLHRYSQQQDIAIGSPVANRNRKEIESLIGFFVNTLVLRFNFTEVPTFRELLKQANRVTLEADEYQDLPFDKLVEALQPVRDTSHSPLFQVMFSYQKSPVSQIEWQDIILTPLPNSQVTETFDLSLLISESENNLTCYWEYNSELFSSETIQRLADSFETLLTDIVFNPDKKVSELSILSSREKQQVLSIAQSQQNQQQIDKFALELIKEKVEKTPDKVAIIWENQQLTYRELNQRVNQLANYLQSLGVIPETLVGICVQRSLEMVVGILAILQAGGAYVPIDPANPQERIAYILEDTQTQILLTQERLLDKLPEFTVKTIFLDTEWAEISTQSTECPDNEVQPDNLAYIIYTSGSTGKPKGVMIEQRSLTNFTQMAAQIYNITAQDRILQFASISFDTAVEEIFPCLSQGATLVLRTEEMLLSPNNFWEDCQKYQITILNFPTAYWHYLTAELTPNDARIPEGLKLVIIGGEQAQIEQVQRWKQAIANFPHPPKLVNGYGPTEGTVTTSFYYFGDKEEVLVPIGKPLPNAQVYILDANLQPLPIGVAGELHIGGAGLARGYLNRPELTAEKFIDYAFDGYSPTRLYKTGDLARYRDDGNLEFLGRIDNQVKIRGFRIELGEIETLLMQHPQVRVSVVTVREDKPQNQQLVAYIIPQSEQISKRELRQFLKQKLPDYMLPNAWVMLDAFPLTTNNKIDYRALPAPTEEIASDNSFIAPYTPTQGLIADTFAAVLHREKIGIDDNFFVLGGHSLLAAQVVYRLREIFQIDIPLRYLFEFPTVTELEQAILQQQQAAIKLAIPPIVPTSRETEHLPLSSAQSRLWFLNQLAEINNTYNIAAAFHLQGNLDIAALEKAIQIIEARHEVLRANFHSINGVPVQTIHPDSRLKLSVVDVEDVQQLASLVTLAAQQPFNLAEDCLIRAKIWRINAQDYVLLLALHHIIADGWSMGVLTKELGHLYENLVGNLSVINSLPALEIQYIDYVFWQRQWLTGQVLETELNYWRQQLADAPPLLELPTDKPRPARQTFNGDVVKFQIDGALSQQLKALSQQSNATLYMTLLTAFVCLLYRYTGQDDILIGSPFANRNQRELEPLIGFFVNTVVLRTQIQDNPQFSDLLLQVRQTALEAYAHQNIPFEEVVEVLQPERNLSYSPLFQVMFDVVLAGTEKINLSGLELQPYALQNNTAKFDLTLILQETATGLEGYLEYNSDLFNRDTITRMSSNLQTLLADIVTQPHQRVSELSLLSTAEKQQLLIDWNGKNADNSVTNKLVHELFAEQVAHRPNAIAVVCGEQKLTYAELDRQANQLAHHLQKLGVGTETLVGLCVDRSSEIVIGMLAILKAGGAYVPLDPNYPPERLQFMQEDAQFPILITQERWLERLGQHDSQIICLDKDWEIIAQESEENPTTKVAVDNLAYVIYTSGSTGKPKGVQIEHRGLLNLISWHQKEFAVSPLDRATQIAGVAFDACGWEIWPYITAGASIYVVDDETRQTPEKLRDWLIANAITISFVPTPLAEKLLALDWSENSVLRILLTGGEKLNLYPLASHSFRLVNNYGPTENSVVSTSGYVPVVNSEDEKLAIAPNIGMPITNTQVYILDQHLQLLPIGVAGELYIAGTGLARGYLNRPDLTAEKFIANPLSEQPESRLYKTGDLVRYLPDGNIEFVGRVDNQVKIRGFRIELGEIEAALLQHPHVKTAIVRVWEAQPGDQSLVAYILAETPTPSSEELRQFLQQKLPDYMLPSAWVMLDNLPLTANGKIDYRALPTPTRELHSSFFVKPSTPTQELIADIIAEVLRLERVGINDNFFALGGHSLLATQVISRLRDTFKVDLPLRSLFEFPTVAGLEKAIASQLNQSALPPATIEPLPRDTNTFPLSFAQLRLWFLEQLEEKSTVYNMPFAWHLHGNLNTVALEKAIQAVVQRHEVLRTNFRINDDTPVQIIHADVNIYLPIVDISHCDDPQLEAQKLAAIAANAPFDLTQDILIRPQLLLLGKQEYVLLLTLHHIIADGWSMGIIEQEISSFYQTLLAGEALPSSTLLIQYADYAVWQRQWLKDEVLQGQLDYWLQQLNNAPPLLELPISKPRPAVQTFAGDSLLFQLNSDLTQQINQLSRRANVTLFMTLLTAFVTLLYRYSKQEDILIGSPIANRNHHATESLVGFFVNTLVLRTQIQDNPTFLELLQQVRQTSLDAYMHQDVPFEKVVEALQPERSLSYHPVFQVMFVLQNAATGELNLEGVNWSPFAIQNTTTNFDLTLSLLEKEGQLYGEWSYSRDLFTETDMSAFSNHFQTLLTNIVAHPEQKITHLPLLSLPEQQQILQEWNQRTISYPQDKCIHELVAIQATKTPHKVAVVQQNQQLTYQELNERANQLAHYLQSLGVQPETLVGVCAEHSLEMIVGLLAILKAGGAYVPIDPKYPQQRQEYIWENAQLKILLTQEKLLDQLSNYQGKTVCLDRDWTEISQYSPANPLITVSTHNLAYIIYTSGSTGQPKGVMIEQRSLTNFTQVAFQEYGITEEDRFLQFISMSFDPAAGDIFGCLSIGATLVLRTEEMLLSSDEFWQYCQDAQVTAINLPTSYWHQLVGELSLEDVGIPRSLLRLIVGGEQIQIKAVNHWQKAVADFLNPPKLINAYGPTESTIAVTFHIFDQSEVTSAPIGLPMANSQVYVLDKNLQPVPIGVPGELHIGGICLARGYLHRPDLTQAKFIPNPFDVSQSTRLYKTGDLVRYLPDGNLEFVSRIDNQVKIRGFRIELGEIETLLMQHPQVQTAVVTVWEEQPGNKKLVAYIVPHSPAITSEELRQFLQLQLPEYMLPTAWVMLESLPLTSNGKIDYRALPQPELNSTNRRVVDPRNTIELQLTKIWSEILNVYPVGVTDNFFELGGHSLLAVTLMSKIKQQFGQQLPLSSIFQNGTIEQQATLLHQQTTSRPWSPLVPLQTQGNKSPLFIVHPGGGSVLNYVHLAEALSPHQPVYGLETRGFDEGQEPQSELIEMSRDYIQALQTIQPQGPYYIAGWCFGGLVAFEIAQQLTAQGQEVALLAFLDMYDFLADVSTQLLTDVELFMSFFGGHLQVSPEFLAQFNQEEQLLYLIAEAKKLKFMPPDFNLAQLHRLLKVGKCHDVAATNYVPQHYKGKITMLQALEGVTANINNPTQGWEKLAYAVDLRWVPGDHRTMLHSPHVQVLAENLLAAMEQANLDI
ncbi:non-ribosomal peptide synthetase [Nostoc sp. FACHB-110]|uniref:non-ribosomal peptide synthetase n=1 Tax=Nostoc sp. FACHB-110 TaxID=2692834 RepID=UPI001689A70D|nr:non-ribosomal peptide synthetase [Nostoc sp. FACHB-110]MBD2440161.1 amino acid adenylation domain-containing protein [Nostoc sp. FACHB-110]